ncbi:hypothetical protein Q7A53_05625 [Halobacillus rhizosphaerae]|uniref:hypothetical protein n=1 Tax=Halobacillus rhizosphaerae TaxID=3064889 RepID=UPI00398B035E
MESKMIQENQAKDGTEFIVEEYEDGLYTVYTKFPYTSGSEKYKNNFVGYSATDLTDLAVAKGIAMFAYFNYSRALKQYATEKENVK